VLFKVSKIVQQMSASNVGSKIKRRSKPPNIPTGSMDDFDDPEDAAMLLELEMASSSAYPQPRVNHGNSWLTNHTT
jgi:hypothetical protein